MLEALLGCGGLVLVGEVLERDEVVVVGILLLAVGRIGLTLLLKMLGRIEDLSGEGSLILVGAINLVSTVSS